jgi:signal transduction histidine kinase
MDHFERRAQGAGNFLARVLLSNRPVERQGGAGQEEGGEGAVPEALDSNNLSERVTQLEAQIEELRNLTKNLDLVVLQRTRALAESEAQLRRKNIELERLTRVRAEFIAIAAHELRTPMTSLVGYLDLFTEKVMSTLGVEPRRQVQSLHRSAHRLKRLVEDMLDVSRFESGNATLRPGPCQLTEIVLAVVDEMRPIVGGRRKLELDMGEIPTLNGDADKLHQMISNLVQNAVKFTSEGGHIRISLDLLDGQARLRVRDNGRGIAPAERERVFEPFIGLGNPRHHSSSVPDSANLGLRITRGIVELHGGTIHVDSEVGKFTEMTVLLPFKDGRR